MVEVLCYPPTPIPQDVVPMRGLLPSSSSRIMTREEHRMKEMNLRKLGLRPPPKRSTTTSPDAHAVAQLQAVALPQPTRKATAKIEKPRSATPTFATLAQAARVPIFPEQRSGSPHPAVGSPRRSYSVMDYEPVPKTEQPSSGIKLPELPTEIHYAIFDLLDPIDSICLGLTSKHFYAVHKHFHGDAKMALTTRRQGPNNVEWAWRLANQITDLSVPPEHVERAINHLEAYAIRGATYCRKCGASKCELHRHIKEWMGEEWEYCSVMGKFAKPAPRNGVVRDVCFRRKPNDPHACGRHRKQKPGLNRMATI